MRHVSLLWLYAMHNQKFMRGQCYDEVCGRLACSLERYGQELVIEEGDGLDPLHQPTCPRCMELTRDALQLHRAKALGLAQAWFRAALTQPDLELETPYGRFGVSELMKVQEEQKK